MKSVVLEEMYSSEEVKVFNEERKDWTAVCRVCKVSFMSSLAELRAHKVNCHGE